MNIYYIKAINLTVVVFSLMILTGCATILKGPTQPFNVTSNVDGADIYIDGELIGQTPFSGSIGRKKSATLRVSKDGYKEQQMILDGSIEPVFWVNIFGSGFGSTTDLVTGNMWKISPNTYNVDLQPVGE